VGTGRDGHHPRRHAGLEPLEQQVGQKERGKVIERERVLQPVGGLVAMRPEPADVVEEDIQPQVGVEDLCGEATDLGLG
jgi:hypothetical protein